MRIRVYPSRLAGSVAVLLFAVSAFANNNDNPYQGIVDRNVFGLHPPPPPPSTEPPKPPLPPVNLTGITTMLGKKLAFLTVQLPVKPGEQAKPGPTSLMLSEGEGNDGVEVIAIDEKAGTVKLSISGTVTNVTFGKLPATPTPAMAGGPAIPNPPGAIPAPGAQRSIPGLPTRTLRLGNNNASAQGAINGQPNPNVGIGQPAGSYQPQANAADVQAANRSPEENVLLYEANRLKNEQLIQAGAKLPRLPQHPWAPGAAQGQPQPQ